MKKTTNKVSETDKVVFKNINKPVIEVRHQDLKRTGESPFRSECPECVVGMMLMKRESKAPHALIEHDVCCLCGQHYIYTDLDEVFDEFGYPKTSTDETKDSKV